MFTINNTLQLIDSFKYLGAIIDGKGSKAEILSRIYQTIAAIKCKINMLILLFSFAISFISCFMS